MNKIFIFTVSALMSLSLQAQRQWTLQECLDYARQNNITLQKSRLQQQQAQEELKASQAALLPSMNLSSNQSMGYSPWKDAGIATVTNGQVNSKVDKSYYNGSYSVSAQWTVWNGGRNYNNVRLSKLSAEQAELTYGEQVNTIQERIAQLYVQCLYLTEAIKVTQAALETARQNEDRGKTMVEVGKMSKADLAQLTAQRATDEYNVVEAQSQLANCKLQLKQLLELTGEEPFDIAVPETTNDMALESIPALHTVYERAMEQRPEIKNALKAIESSNISVKVARAGWLPTLGMSAGAGTSTNSLSSNAWGKQMKTNFDIQGGLSLSLPLFDQRQTRTAYNKAKIAQQQAQLDLMDKQKTLYQTIEGFWLDATTNQQKLRASMATVESEEQSFGLLQEQFALGLKNIIELLQGKDKLLQAQQNMLQSKYMTILNLQLLKFYEGELRIEN